MSITNGYATLAEYKKWMREDDSTIDLDDDIVIGDIIEGASRDIDLEMGRTFYARTETRYYDVPSGGNRELRVDDDLLTITTLTNGDANTIASTEYNLVPKNVTPYYAIKLKASSSTYWDFDSSGNSENVISVAGTWGITATAPHDIRQLCLNMANQEYKRRFGEGEQTAIVTGAGVVLSPSGINKKLAIAKRRYSRYT